MVSQPSSLLSNKKHIDTNGNTVSTLKKRKISQTTDKELTVTDAPNKKRVRMALSVNKPDSDDGEIQRETVSHAEYVKVRSTADEILSKYQSNSHLIVKPLSQDSWLIRTIKQVITSTDRVIQPHKYRFETIAKQKNSTQSY